MFEEYLQDASDFFEMGRKAANSREARRYYRASIFYASGAMEAFVNYITDTYQKGGMFATHEIAFLTDKSLSFCKRKFILKEKVEFHKVEDKIKFLLKTFSPNFNFESSSWSALMDLKALRDSLIHPKSDEDPNSSIAYEKSVFSGLNGVISTMDTISREIFKKPLRAQILDLRPEK